ncbi:hypothetical protein POVWA2_048490 [Plasmodium ovale wallikeri]|uniref:Uncharacterized protein n=1 Tax=Plasmodium ovale wallikeri TaxID=864142 RepID=A0A1A8ZK01_PLAOA|nr:hypothetical protein POVWA1_049450 [Plasmodium ovale wallikeri]SBT44739.1 hypothetical protein POVWA2_048490 [Plasmodium ovale wallikeri]
MGMPRGEHKEGPTNIHSPNMLKYYIKNGEVRNDAAKRKVLPNLLNRYEHMLLSNALLKSTYNGPKPPVHRASQGNRFLQVSNFFQPVIRAHAHEQAPLRGR